MCALRAFTSSRVVTGVSAGLWDGEFPICLGSAPADERQSQPCVNISKTYPGSGSAFIVVGPSENQDFWNRWYTGLSQVFWPTLGPCLDSSQITGPLPRELVSQTPFILATEVTCAGLGAR